MGVLSANALNVDNLCDLTDSQMEAVLMSPFRIMPPLVFVEIERTETSVVPGLLLVTAGSERY